MLYCLDFLRVRSHSPVGDYMPQGAHLTLEQAAPIGLELQSVLMKFLKHSMQVSQMQSKCV